MKSRSPQSRRQMKDQWQHLLGLGQTISFHGYFVNLKTINHGLEPIYYVAISIECVDVIKHLLGTII